MSERDYKAEVAKAADAAPNNPPVIAAILQAQALFWVGFTVSFLALAVVAFVWAFV